MKTNKWEKIHRTKTAMYSYLMPMGYSVNDDGTIGLRGYSCTFGRWERVKGGYKTIIWLNGIENCLFTM